MNGSELVELRLRGQLPLRLGGKLRLVGENVDIFPLGIGGEGEVTGEDSGSGTTEFITRELGKRYYLALGEVVDAAFHTGKLGGALAPTERFLNACAFISHNSERIIRLFQWF